MATLSESPDPRAIEAAARAVWAAQHLPPPTGPVGPGEGPVVHQFEGAFAPQEDGILVVQRAVAADTDARALILVGRRTRGILRKEEGGPATPAPRLEPILTALGIWVGGPDGRNWDSVPRRSEVQTLVGRLAHMRALAVRDVSLRICPACAMARSPERIVYQEEYGETLLVRFPFQSADRTISALVWTDAPWRLLGTSALMVHPDLPYVIARYRRRGTEELVFTSRASLDRIRGWLPGAELEVLEEGPGRHWVGQAYVHPLRHEFPMGGSMEPPAGTILSVADVSNTGTGVVPLVPGHGGTDTQIADRLNVPGWPLITPKGRFDILFVHKYAGLELESGSEFVERDLAEGDAIFARLRVRRGVPHCARCSTALIWAPGRAWCLEPSRLPEEKVAVYRSLLPDDRPIERLEAVPWPVSEPQRSDDPLAITLLECSQCDLLEAADAPAERCSCGGRRRAVRRRLLPAFDAAAAAWATVDPFPLAHSARIYVGERRRAPAVVHHVAAMSGVTGGPGEVHLTVLPTVPEANLRELIAARGADVVRAALVRAQSSEGATATFPERCLQEERRLHAFWKFARETLSRMDGPALSLFGQPIRRSMGDLEPEDRALLARFERLRIQCLVDYDHSRPGLVHRRLFQFLENDLVTYRSWVAPRLGLEGNPPSQRAAMHTLVHVLSNSTALLGPIAPHTAEVVHRALHRGRASLFEEPPVGADQELIDESRVKAWDRWLSVVRALERWRRSAGVAAAVVLPSVALVVDSDAEGDPLRADAPTVERLARVAKVEVASPGAPWAGRRRELRPREPEIQRVYASRAAQIIHLLRRMPERKGTEPGTGQGFSMVVNGQQTQILPSMIEWVETLPPHFVPVGWNGGELYVELPPASRSVAPAPPPLSRDGFGVVSRVAHRLRAGPAGSERAVIVVAPPALAAELTGVSDLLAKYLGIRDFRVVTPSPELPAHEREVGRSRGGTAWWFHIVGSPPSVRRSKPRPPHPRGARLRPAFAPGDLAPTALDYADPALVAREAGVRALGEQLDEILGAPLLGPAKVAAAWDSGLRSVEAFRGTPWATFATMPGFGPPIATALVTKFGGDIPRRPPRGVRPPAAPPAAGMPRGHDSGRSAGFEAPPPSSDSPGDGTTIAPAPSVPEALPTAPPLPAPLDVGPSQAQSPREAIPPTRERDAGDQLPVPESEEAELPLSPAAELDPGPAPLTPSPPMDLLEGSTGMPAMEPMPGTVPETEGTPSPPEHEVIPGRDDPAPEPDPEGGPVAGQPTDAPDTFAATPPAVPELGSSESATEAPVEALPAVDDDTPMPPVAETELSRTGPAVPDPAPSPATESPVPEGTTEPMLEARGSSGPPLRERPSAPIAELPLPEAGPEEGKTSSPSEIDRPELVATPDSSPPTPIPGGGAGRELLPPAVAESAAPVPVVVEPIPPELLTALEPAPVAPPEASPPPVPTPAPVGGIDLAVGPSYVPSLERFLEATAAGHQGVCVVRDSPERVRAYVGSRPVELRWLTNIGRGATLKPTDLEGFSAFLAHSVTASHVTAFFIEGTEYLVRLHGLEKVVDRLIAFDRLTQEHSARVWMTLNPKLLSQPELDRFVALFGSPAP